MAGPTRKAESIRATLTSRINVPNSVLFQDLDGEAVILNQKSGKYYGLDPTGARMWALLIEYGQIERAYRALLEVYDVTEEQLRTDLLGFVEKLADQELLQIDNG